MGCAGGAQVKEGLLKTGFFKDDIVTHLLSGFSLRRTME
jgi:hypothetical protein